MSLLRLNQRLLNQKNLFFLPARLLPRHFLVIFFLISPLLNNLALADTIYKSVDKDGNISYSSSPRDDSQATVKVTIQPPPSTDEAEAAQQRHQQNLRANKLFEENRQRRSQHIADEKRIKREKQDQANKYQKPDAPEEGPYYGIPGHGILVLPRGPHITPRTNR